jgi:hypothetical protein
VHPVTGDIHGLNPLPFSGPLKQLRCKQPVVCMVAKLPIVISAHFEGIKVCIKSCDHKLIIGDRAQPGSNTLVMILV